MDGRWRRDDHFMVITGHKTILNNNRQVLDTLFDMSVNIHVFQVGDSGRALGSVYRPVRIMYLCCCYINCSLARNNQYSNGCGVYGISEGIDFNSSAVREQIMKHMLVLPVMLVVMIPCTGGTRWQHINPRAESGFPRLKTAP